MLQTFSRTLSLSPEASEALLSLPLTTLLDSPELSQLLGSLDTNLLKESLHTHVWLTRFIVFTIFSI